MPDKAVVSTAETAAGHARSSRIGIARGVLARLPSRLLRALLRVRRRGSYHAEAARPWGAFSISRRILSVNLVILALLAGGMLYFDRYERGLIDTELQALTTQASLFGAALGEGAVLQDYDGSPVIVPSLAQGMMRRLVEPTGIRARLFRSSGDLIADSRLARSGLAEIIEEPLPPPGMPEAAPVAPSEGLAEDGPFNRAFDNIMTFWHAHAPMKPYLEHFPQRASDYEEVKLALQGKKARRVRIDPQRADGNLVLSVAVPVYRYKLVLGAVMLSVGSADLEHQVRVVREDILRLFAAALVVMVLLSFYLASTIARPVRLLARAAFNIRHGGGREVQIPDLSRRRDEIGELSVALNEMTRALWRRMDAIERFAADVAHELKNPLTSLRSAVETAARVRDPDVQRRLMTIIADDVQRLDRLISDISDASRLDAEMSRLERGPVDLAGMLTMLQQIHEATRDPAGPVLVVDLSQAAEPLVVAGKEGRLVQVFRNLIGNAVSFSPPGGRISIVAIHDGQHVDVSVEDEGPGIPEGKLEAVFERFYTERPIGEKFGTHSGLGLSISRQIVEAHGGHVRALNRLDGAGVVIGARFVVRLPLSAP